MPDTPPRLGGKGDNEFSVPKPLPLRTVIRNYLDWVLAKTQGHRRRAAKLLKISQGTLRKYAGYKHEKQSKKD